MNTVILLGVFIVIGVVAGAPQAPTISDIFSASYTLNSSSNPGTPIYGKGTFYCNVPAGMCVKTDIYSSDFTNTVLSRYDLGLEFTLENNNCTAQNVSGPLPSPWDWVSMATFNGTYTFQGHQLDSWILNVGRNTQAISVYSNTNTPARMSNLARGFEEFYESYIFESFAPAAPHPSVFDIPKSCPDQ